jgi:hypothetical protein
MCGRIQSLRDLLMGGISLVRCEVGPGAGGDGCGCGGGGGGAGGSALGSSRLKIAKASVLRSTEASRSGCRQLKISLNSSGVSLAFILQFM